jgi:polysaccharide export outer membrane protein
MRKVFFSCIILLGFAGGLFAQATVDDNNITAADSNYVIGEEDVLSVDVWKEADLSVKGRAVRLDGMIGLPLIGEVYASGKTTKQLQDEIAEKLKDIIIDPIVLVEVERIFSHKVSISGKIGKAGLYAIGAPTTVLDIINRAGGPAATAKIKKIIIVRTEDGKTTRFLFNYKDVIQGKDLNQNIFVKNGDMILVQ